MLCLYSIGHREVHCSLWCSMNGTCVVCHFATPIFISLSQLGKLENALCDKSHDQNLKHTCKVHAYQIGLALEMYSNFGTLQAQDEVI